MALFGLCWLPLHTFFALHDFSSAFRELLESKSVAPFAGLLYFACHWLAMANSFVNPLIYFTMQSSFRVRLFSALYPFVRIYSYTSCPVPRSTSFILCSLE